jgi:hypothetical protein
MLTGYVQRKIVINMIMTILTQSIKNITLCYRYQKYCSKCHEGGGEHATKRAQKYTKTAADTGKKIAEGTGNFEQSTLTAYIL